MKKQFCLLGLLLLFFSPQAARADLGFWSAHLVGTWRHPKSGDKYHFRSDATYQFKGGAKNRRRGNVSHSGFWKIVQPTEKESGGSMEGPVALLLKMRSRVGFAKDKQRVMREKQTFRLVVDTARRDGEMIDKNRYRIGGVLWKRYKTQVPPSCAVG